MKSSNNMTKFGFGGLLSVALGLFTMSAAHAQLTTLTSFTASNGAFPQAGLTLSSDGTTLYGTTIYAGSEGGGTVFSLSTSGGMPDTLADFNRYSSGSDGSDPLGDLTLSSDGSTLYGTTKVGGYDNAGTVFSVPVTGGGATTLADLNGTDGSQPYAGLTLTGGNLYGTTSGGGTNSAGTVFSVPVPSGPPSLATPSVLVNFDGNSYGSDGAYPYAGLIQSLNESTLYGTTSQGGVYFGTVFSMPVTGSTPTTPTTLTSFSGSSTGGGFPTAKLTLSLDGTTLYGTTTSGGTHGLGTVFSLPVGGGTPDILASFNGSSPSAGLTLVGGMLYGTTTGGGIYGDGTVFSLPVGGGAITTLFSFDGADGTDPAANLTASADGSTLYGTTESGGDNNFGTVFAIAVPEPSSWSLLLCGLGLLAFWRYRTWPGACSNFLSTAALRTTHECVTLPTQPE